MKAIKSLVISLFIFSPFVHANDFIWKDNFSNNSITDWDYQLNPSGIKLVKDPLDPNNTVASFSLSEKDTWPNGHSRVELKHNASNSDDKNITQLEFKFLTQHLFHHQNNIAYWESDVTYLQSFSFSIEAINNKNHLVLSTNLPNKKEHFNIPFNNGEWHSVSTKITWSESINDGRLTVYFNNKRVIKNLRIQTKPDKNRMFTQMGLHRDSIKPGIDTILIKEVIENKI